VYKNIILRQLI